MKGKREERLFMSKCARLHLSFDEGVDDDPGHDDLAALVRGHSQALQRRLSLVYWTGLDCYLQYSTVLHCAVLCFNALYCTLLN